MIDGAEQGGRSVSGGDGDIPVLNAHESLKAAAERDGAPLCGNRVWAAGGEVRADRAGSETRLAPLSADVVGQLEVLHGGKAIRYFAIDGSAADTLALEWPGGAGDWTDATLDAVSGPRGGTQGSLFGFSHDRDTLAVIDGDPVWDTRWYETEDTNDAPVLLEVPPESSGEQIGRIPVDDFEEPVDTPCLERDASDPDVCFLSVAESRVWLFRLGYPQFPDTARGGRQASVAVGPMRDVRVDSTTWQTCTFDSARECRAIQFRQLQAGALAYRMDLDGTGNTPVRIDSIPGESIFWIGHGESGDELALGRGEVRITFWADAETFEDFGTPFRSFEGEIVDCKIEYRTREGFEPVGSPIPSDDACFFLLDFDELDPASGGGTIAPSVTADTDETTRVPLPVLEATPDGVREVNQ